MFPIGTVITFVPLHEAAIVIIFEAEASQDSNNFCTHCLNFSIIYFSVRSTTLNDDQL